MLRDASPRDARSTRRNARKRSQLRTHPDINREWLRRRDRAVVEQHVRYRVGDRRLRIEEGAEGREFAIEQVVYDPVIPNPIDQNPWAHWRSPMDMMRQG